MAAGWSSFIATGPVVELAENGSWRILERGRLNAGNLRLPWIGA
jgi:hypothetical protein